MTAEALVLMHGQSLVGRQVMTEAVGDYPGGIARVNRLCDDEDDILYFVMHPTEGEMGVFRWEKAHLIPRECEVRA